MGCSLEQRRLAEPLPLQLDSDSFDSLDRVVAGATATWEARITVHDR